MLCSIIINNYNYARYLGEAIESALDQTYQNCEIIIVDDGSTDESRSLLERYRSKTTIIFQENRGQASAFNTGLRAAHGEWVWFLDADDVLASDAVSTAFDLISAETVAFQARLRVVDADGVPDDRGRLMPNGALAVDDQAGQLLKLGAYRHPPTSGNMFRKNALEKIFPIPEEQYRLCADTYILASIPFLGKVVGFNERPLGCYRIHGNNNYVRSQKIDMRKVLIREITATQLRYDQIRAMARTMNLPQPTSFEDIDSNYIGRKIFFKRISLGKEDLYVADSYVRLMARFIKALAQNQRKLPLKPRIKVLVKHLGALVFPKSHLPALLWW